MRRRDAGRRLALVLAIGLPLGACAHWPANPRLQRWEPDGGYRLDNLESAENSESLFVILAFSGGGTRAAALAYGALEQLGRTRIYWQGQERSLLQEVDVISSVSGGSFTALYYGLHGEAGLPDFKQKFLYAPIQKRLVRRALSPRNWLRLASPNFDRIDMAAELYDREVFGGKTYRSLIEGGGRPFIIVNATDMTLGARFEFTQDQFDLICSDLTDLSVGRAAAASSAFPGLLTPLTLVTYGNACGAAEPAWVAGALESREDNPARYEDARRIERYFAPDNRFIHLIDGGVSDNVGLRGPLHAALSNDSPWSLVDRINRGEIEKLLVISVNAKTASAEKWDSKENAPKLLQVLRTAGSTPMTHYSFETEDRLREEARSQTQLQATVEACQGILDERCPGVSLPSQPPRRVTYHTVEVNFESLEDRTHRDFFQGLPTTFQLAPPVVDCLRGVAGTLLTESERFTAFLDELDKLAREAGAAPPTRALAPGFPWPCRG